MATLTDRELDIAKQIKTQGGTRQDFENVLKQVRQQRPELFEEKIEDTTIDEGAEISTGPSEQEITTQIIEEEPGIDPKMAGSKARQQLAEKEGAEAQAEGDAIPGFFGKRKEGIQETFGEEGLAGEGAERIIEGAVQAGEGEPFKGALKGIEGTFQVAGGTVQELFGTVIDAAGEFGLKPGLEQLDADTLNTVKNITDIPMNFVGELADSDTANSIGDLIEAIPENLRNDFKTGLNLFGLKYSKVKGKNIVKKVKSKNIPGTKGFNVEKLRLAKKTVSDNARLLTNASKKVDDASINSFGKLVSKNKGQLKGSKDFNDLAVRVENIGTRDINTLNKSLSGITKKFKPQGAKETLLEMKNNLDKINFKTADKNTINNLIKKINTEGLTLSEINGVKKLINKYTRGWTKSGLEGAGLKADSIRDKYTEVMKFIENTADRNGIANVKELNNSWATSQKFSNLLNEQAFKAGKQTLQDQLFKPGIVKGSIEKIQRILPTGPGLKDARGIAELEKKLDILIDNISQGYKNTVTLGTP